MSQMLVFLVTYAVVLVIALIATAVFCPRESSLFVTFIVVTLTLEVFMVSVHIWGNLYYPQRCHSCGEPITEAYYEVDEWRWHPGCFTESATYHSEEVPSWQFPAEQEAPSDPMVVNSSPGVENTIERISGTVESAQVKFNQGE